MFMAGAEEYAYWKNRDRASTSSPGDLPLAIVVVEHNSLRMLDSVYYNRGEAIHGYASVPTYPASHGCVRSPIPDARFIYNWVRLGMSIYVY
jgi:lipoprotein-anchoring transpeptidase ErfK/SrfK